MSYPEDQAYFMARAEKEREIANSSEDNIAALAHFRLADAYEARAREVANEQPAAMPGATA